MAKLDTNLQPRLRYRIDHEIVDTVYNRLGWTDDYWDSSDATYANLVRTWLKRAHTIRQADGELSAQYYLEACICLAEAIRQQDELDRQLS